MAEDERPKLTAPTTLDDGVSTSDGPSGTDTDVAASGRATVDANAVVGDSTTERRSGEPNANDGSEDDDDDNINVKIDLQGKTESERLSSLLATNHMSTVPIICNKNYTYHALDLEIEKEIEKLVRISICPATDKHITVQIDNQLILVPHNVRLSDRLASYIWGHHRPYVQSMIPYAAEFDRVLRPNKLYDEAFAIFGAKYNNNTRHDGAACGIHQYSEFAAIVIAKNKIVDYAIHGYRSNIVAMIEKHKPRRIYYNAKNKSLTDFLEYKCQPFYQAVEGLLRPLQLPEPNQFDVMFNPLSFCDRRNVFCALCRCLKDAYIFFNFAKRPTTLKIPQRLKNFVTTSSRSRAPLSPLLHRRRYSPQSSVPVQYHRRDYDCYGDRDIFEYYRYYAQHLSMPTAMPPLHRYRYHDQDPRAIEAMIRDRREREMRSRSVGLFSGRSLLPSTPPTPMMMMQTPLPSQSLFHRDASANYAHLKRIRNDTDRFRGQRRKCKMYSFNSNLDF